MLDYRISRKYEKLILYTYKCYKDGNDDYKVHIESCKKKKNK